MNERSRVIVTHDRVPKVPPSAEDRRLRAFEPSSLRAFEPSSLRAFEQRVQRIKDLPAEIAEAIQRSKMNPAHDYLNALLDESQK